MKAIVVRTCLAMVPAMLLVGWSGGSHAQGSYQVDGNVVRLVKEMGQYLSQAESFEFSADVTEEVLLSTGEKVHLSSQSDVVVRHPDRFWVWRDTTSGSTYFTYDGRVITAVDEGQNMFSAVRVGRTIDEALDDIFEMFNVSIPLSAFIRNDPASALLRDVTRATYVGHHPLDGVVCDHVVLSSSEVEWQIWITTGRRKLPQKFVIHFKNEPGSPTVVARFTEWHFVPVPDVRFLFEPLPGAVEIEFLEIDVEG